MSTHRNMLLWSAGLFGLALISGGVFLGFTASLTKPAAESTRAGQAPQGLSSPAQDASTRASEAVIAGKASAPSGEQEIFHEPVQPWETAISGLLDSPDENGVVADRLAALAPTLPLEGQKEAVLLMVGLVDDERYDLVRSMLLDAALHPGLRDIIFADALDRPRRVKLPLLVDLLEIRGHPLHEEARANLQVLLGSDAGANPESWRESIRQTLTREEEEAKGQKGEKTERPID